MIITYYKLPKKIGDTWRTHRKLIAPTFHTNVLKTFVDLFNKNSKLTVEKLKQFNGKTFDCHEYMCEATVEILLGEKLYFLYFI